MGLFSPSISFTRYRIDGQIPGPVNETVADSLKKHSISDIDGDASDRTFGWTSLSDPYHPRFDDLSFVFGTEFVFSLRLDKKNIPSQVIRKHCVIEEKKRLEKSGRNYLTKNEKQIIKETVIHTLSLRIPSTPNIYDVVWRYESGELFFLSTLKSANEIFETLFTRTFHLTLIRIFPYTQAFFKSGLTDNEKDLFEKLGHEGMI